jgi:hypothetical protein
MTLITDQINERKLSGTKLEPLAAAIINYPEEYRCPACDSLIPPTMMKREEETHPQSLQMARKVSIYCGHCNAAFAARFALRNGLLAQLDTVHRVDLDDLKKLKEEFGVITGDLSLAAGEWPADPQEDEAARRERLIKDREDLFDRITATELHLQSLLAAYRRLQQASPSKRPYRVPELLDNQPGWEPSGSLDQESCQQAQARRIAEAQPGVVSHREAVQRQEASSRAARQTFDTSTSQLV